MVAHPDRRSAETSAKQWAPPVSIVRRCRSFALTVAPPTVRLMHTQVSEAVAPDPEGDGDA
jgi:hypothetical protein